MNDTKPPGWHLDKTISLSVILLGVAQLAGGIWWVGSVADKTRDHGERIQRIEAQRANERLAALESQMIDSRGSLVRIENKLDRLIEKGTRP